MPGSQDSTSPESRDPLTSPPRGRPVQQPHEQQQAQQQGHHYRQESQGVRREKKRVGFSGSGDDSGQKLDTGSASASGVNDPKSLSPGHSPINDPFLTPNPQPEPRQDEEDDLGPGPEPAALRRALTKILVTEADGSERLASGASSPGPNRPRPALRRNTSYDVPQEKEAADFAEKRTTERQQRSGLAARERADRLAVSVEGYSQPPSRRGSNDMFPFPVSTDEEDEGARHEARATGAERPVENQSSQIRSRVQAKSEVVAENLVRKHTKKGKKGGVSREEFFMRRGEAAMPSRPGTPTEEKDYAHDYVPRPEKYHGGILSSLLKLYNEGKESGENSGGNTPVSATPNTSPPRSRNNSRPPSRPWSRSTSPMPAASSPTSPKPSSRPSSGIFGYHKHQASRSSLALSELMKSTSTLIAPGSSGMSGEVSEKIKQDQKDQKKKRKSGGWGSPKSKKRDDKIRITKHIAQILSRHKYLLKLCRALMMYGAPTHRLEEYMTMSARVLEIEGQFLYIPNCMIISFDDSSTHTTEVKIIRTRQGVDLGKLRDVHDLYKEVVHDRMGVDEATSKLDQIMNRKLKYSNWLRVPVYGLASACVAPFAFQGRFIDLPIAFILGCILGFLQLILAPSNELYANVFEITAAILTSFLARFFGSLQGGNLFCFSALAQSSIALILPGYMVLCSSLELQSHNLVAGSVRMVYAMIYTLFLGYGITIGTAIYGLIDREGATSETTCRDPLDRQWHLLFVPAFTLCLCVVNQAKWKQTPVMLAISLAGFLVNSYSASFFKDNGNAPIANMLGALTVGILANLYSRLGRHVTIAWYSFVDWYYLRVVPRFSSASRRRNDTAVPEMYQGHRHHVLSDVESRPASPISSMPPSPGAQSDVENEKPSGTGSPTEGETRDENGRRPIGYGLAAAAMLPAIFVQVPSGLAAGGSLLAGVTSADQLTSNINGTRNADDDDPLNLDGSAFGVLFSVIQVAIGITVGLFLSALIVYPLGKRRSGLLSF